MGTNDIRFCEVMRKEDKKAVRMDDVKVCEGIMRDYSKMRATLRMLKQMVLSPSSDGDRVEGGESIPAAQKMMEDKKIESLSAIIQTVERAVRDLPEDPQKAVILVYMIGMNLNLASVELNCNRATVYRWCMKGLILMSSKVKRLYNRVIDWREEWDRDIISGFGITDEKSED